MSATATLTNCYVPLPANSNNNNSYSSANDNYDPYARPTNDHHNGDSTLHHPENTSAATTSSSSTTTATRGPRTLRQLHLAKSILSQSTGSALVEWGHTKLMVSVRGPRPIHCSSLNSTTAATTSSMLQCEVRYMSHVGIRMETLAKHSLAHDFASSSTSTTGGGGGGGGGGARIPRDTIASANDTSNLLSGGSLCAPAAFLDETYLSRRLYEALVPSVMVDDDANGNNKMCVEVFVQVLQSDGGVFGAAVMGASLALADAGVKMRDLVCASSAAVMMTKEEVDDDENDDDDNNGEGKKNKKKGKKVTYHAIADPTEDEILQACGVVTIAMMPNWKECTVWDQFGKMPVEASSEAMELARDGCMTCHKFLKTCLQQG
jgi:ribonuclease PH